MPQNIPDLEVDLLVCPVRGCLRVKPGIRFIMCKPCWKVVPRPLKAEWKKSLAKVRGLLARCHHEDWPGTAEAAKVKIEYEKAVFRMIQAAYLEPGPAHLAKDPTP